MVGDGKQFQTENISASIRQDVLLSAGSEDHYAPIEQWYQQIRILKNAQSVTGRIFTRSESAQNHCQVGNDGALRTIVAWLDGVLPVGAVFAHHLKMGKDTFDFELGVKVAAPVTAAGRVKPSELPAAKVARTIYSGPYEGLPSAWSEFNSWLEANGHAQGATLWEVYSAGPQSSPDPASWRTELNRPLKD